MVPRTNRFRPFLIYLDQHFVDALRIHIHYFKFEILPFHLFTRPRVYVPTGEG